MPIEVTFLTPTYNRASLLPKLYESLCRQTRKNFQWLIIDDGSTDHTEDIVKSFKPVGFTIDYIKKKNGGKHTAMNYSHPYIKGKVVGIVDSDDYLKDDAAETIESDFCRFKDQSDISSISYIIISPDGKNLSRNPPADYYIADEISYRHNKRIYGDQFLVIKTDAFVQFKLPVFPGERFMSEGPLYRFLALHSKTVYRSKAIYVGDYLENGLTKQGRHMRMKNPYGMIENSNTCFVPGMCFREKCKKAILFDLYAMCTKEGLWYHILHNCKAPRLCTLMSVLGIPMYYVWHYYY